MGLWEFNVLLWTRLRQRVRLIANDSASWTFEILSGCGGVKGITSAWSNVPSFDFFLKEKNWFAGLLSRRRNDLIPDYLSILLSKYGVDYLPGANRY